MAQNLFRLILAFVVIASIAGGLVVASLWWQVPMTSGSIYTCLCYKKDWDKLTQSMSGIEQGKFRLYTFTSDDLVKLFEHFSVQPQLWGKIEIPRYLNEERGIRMGTAVRTRPINQPVEGRGDHFVFGVDEVTDVFMVQGTFQQSISPWNLYTIDFDTQFVTFPLSRSVDNAPTFSKLIEDMRGELQFTSQVPDGLPYHLSYHGPFRGLIIFARPVDTDLVHLVIVQPK